MLLATLIVGGLKAVTNVDCPWDLTGFGGHNPYVALFADRPDALRAPVFSRRARVVGVCTDVFLLRVARSFAPTRTLDLAAAIGVGIAFSIGQEARGAHFLSHDLASAAIVWFVQLGLYAWLSAALTEIAALATAGGRCTPQSTKSNASMCSGLRTR